jgi:hypothetical protein
MFAQELRLGSERKMEICCVVRTENLRDLEVQHQGTTSAEAGLPWLR